MRIKTGDTVIVIAGKDKGTQATVKQTLPKQDKVIVEGVNIVKKHQKPSQANPQGGIVEEEAPIHVSNVQLVDPKTGEKTRVGIEVKDGKRVRVARKSGEAID
ncbi:MULTISPECIES: 50S ribosomal protein L24 [Aerococcus]|uniref:Large ribosomal subunit protein uL24 n=1 Tax=Aerococcus sanguinicola TaxID=119206 RepID=A0A5N1GN61_9LACT|nr:MULTISPECIES: 50S ribosomal protein L24 [Aerococcus]KAA9302405.1 50S ribosomal protein L24 [Aerococcus sanguinicola]MDK6369779.1 50S ribosomal protein L24 [Aerococcus sp. UMB9870]MDK6680419.1 50S ribosomal protein L24 [Aerococcus sp. UMB8608]MDK6687084.1 50S ribosomal protein L24 [Aerococcus sp. UMB8623]MDK6940303.1 50S ribosomal protein L24 [Aerococcus sp. UMB8487]